MKLLSFEAENRLTWGFLLCNPRDGKEWVYEPAKVVKNLLISAGGTGYANSMSTFVPDIEWPDSLAGFLALEEEGMDALQKLVSFFRRFLEQSDAVRMSHVGYLLSEVHLRAPIPSPRLFWGLVGNSSTFMKISDRCLTNFFPMAHQRPAGSVIGPGEYYVQAKGVPGVGNNVEVGVIIGKKGRNIPVKEAMRYVAGYTIVADSQLNGLYPQVGDGTITSANIRQRTDWYLDACCSWGGKMADAHTGVGPYLVTKEEIGNPYDLITTTRNSGVVRERAHTSGNIMGIEQVISWYSTFATIYPGDIIHLGAMARDGIGVPDEWNFNGPDCTLDTEIERVGYLSTPVLDLNKGDWRPDDDITKTMHISPAVRDLIRFGKTTVSAEEWKTEEVRHFFTCFKNYRAAMEEEGYFPSKAPRFLGAPNSALGKTHSVVEVPARANDLEICIELCLAVNGLTQQASLENADDYVLGYMPMISITDSSFDDVLYEPTTPQQKALPLVYGRWADGFNCISACPVRKKWDEVSTLPMHLEAEGIGAVSGSTAEYYSSAKDALKFISSYVTMFPGDVVTLGHIKERIVIPKEAVRDGMVIRGSIEGLGEVELSLKKA